MSNYHFISYSSVDAKEFAFQLYDSLLAGPPSIPVWLDKRKLQAGQDWDEHTAAEVLSEIDFDYLLLWRHYQVMAELHERLQGKLSDLWLKSGSAGNLGSAYNSMGDYQKTIEYYEQALVISKEIGDRRGEGTGLRKLGNAYMNLGQVEKAIESTKRRWS